MRRAVLPFFLFLAVALSVVSVASADPPTRTPSPAAPFSGPFCTDFDVLVTPVINQAYAITFSNGATITTGHLVADVTNLSTGQTIEVNASGPGFVSTNGSTLTLRGVTLIAAPAGVLESSNAPPVSQLVSGVVVIDLTAGMIVSETGHIRDLCAELGG